MAASSPNPRIALLAQLEALQEAPRVSNWPGVAAAWAAIQPDAEDWDLQASLAAVALAFALVDLTVAEAAVALVQQPDLAAKTGHRIYLKIEGAANQLLEADPEAALGLVRPLAPRYRNPVQAEAAALLFAADRPRALALYRELGVPSYFAAAFLKRLAPIDPTMALALAAEFSTGPEREELLGQLAVLIAPVEFAKAEAICDGLEDEKLRQEAYRGLLPHIVVKTPDELFALFANPRYAPVRIPAFALHENLLRAWCEVPLLTPGIPPLELPDVGGDPKYWAIHRKITYSVEADPAGAFALLRAIKNPAWRFVIFEYARAEFLQLR